MYVPTILTTSAFAALALFGSVHAQDPQCLPEPGEPGTVELFGLPCYAQPVTEVPVNGSCVDIEHLPPVGSIAIRPMFDPRSVSIVPVESITCELYGEASCGGTKFDTLVDSNAENLYEPKDGEESVPLLSIRCTSKKV